MKNILFASTALVAFAGAAAADVSIGGRAEVGIFGGDNMTTGASIETQFHTDIDIDFEMSGETDNGLTFGASLDIDEVPSGLGAADDNGVSYFIAFGNARLDMGDTDGAFDAALQETALVGGSINDAETVHAAYNGGNSGLDSEGIYDGQIARFSYTTAGFTGHASVMVDDGGVADAVFGVGVSYDTDLGGTAVGVGLGYQSTNDIDGAGNAQSIWGISADATLAGGLQFAVNYSVEANDAWANDQKHTAVGVGYTMNNIGLGFNYAQLSDVGGVAGADRTSYGLAATYDLGGGMVAQFGYGANTKHETVALEDAKTWSLGLAMSF